MCPERCPACLHLSRSAAVRLALTLALACSDLSLSLHPKARLCEGNAPYKMTGIKFARRALPDKTAGAVGRRAPPRRKCSAGRWLEEAERWWGVLVFSVHRRKNGGRAEGFVALLAGQAPLDRRRLPGQCRLALWRELSRWEGRSCLEGPVVLARAGGGARARAHGSAGLVQRRHTCGRSRPPSHALQASLRAATPAAGERGGARRGRRGTSAGRRQRRGCRGEVQCAALARHVGSACGLGSTPARGPCSTPLA